MLPDSVEYSCRPSGFFFCAGITFQSDRTFGNCNNVIRCLSMSKRLFVILGLLACLTCPGTGTGASAEAIDLRGAWVGKAQGSIFGAEGVVNVVRQKGDKIYGIVEGGNFFGKARFQIQGRVRGNMIIGEMGGNVFQGNIFQDGTIRGMVRTVDGDTYRVFLRRSQPLWGSDPYGRW